MTTKWWSEAILAFSLFLGASGCATVHKGAIETDGGSLRLSAAILSKLSTQNFIFLEFTFQNRSDLWARLKNVKLDLGDPVLNNAVIVTAGRDLEAWMEGMQNQRDLDEYNRRLLWKLLLGGSALASQLEHQGWGGALWGLAESQSVAMSLSELNRDSDRLRTVRVFPETHLYAHDLAIPPGLFLRRWMVIYVPDGSQSGYASRIALVFKNESGAEQRVRVRP